MSYDINEVGIVGLGYVGLTLGLALSRKGYSIVGAEQNEEHRKEIEAGNPHFLENGLERILKAELERGNFRLVDKSIPGCDAYILCVCTPYDNHKCQPNLDVLKHAAKELSQILAESKSHPLVINRATVPIGATRRVIIPILEESGLKCGKDFGLAFAPERTLEGNAMQELTSNPQVIGGYDEDSVMRASEIFSRMTPTIVRVSSLEAAEAIKLLDNTYRDVTFGFANEFAQLCEGIGLDANEITTAAKTHFPRNIGMPFPSPGVGGTCLAKDPHILMSSVAPGTDTTMIYTARRINRAVPKRMVDRIYSSLEQIGANAANPRFFLAGFAFKGNPVTDDMRDSTSLWFLDELRARTTNIIGYDPVVSREKLSGLGIEISGNYLEAAKGADCIVLLNNHQSYKNWDTKKLAEAMKNPGIIFDSWRMLDIPFDLSQHNIKYMSVGK